MVWALTAVPLPIFFAGLIFSTTFRMEKDTASLLGANLIGGDCGRILRVSEHGQRHIHPLTDSINGICSQHALFRRWHNKTQITSDGIAIDAAGESAE